MSLKIGFGGGDASVIPLSVLIEIHLRTHASQSQHSMRGKYCSAVYVKNNNEIQSLKAVLNGLAAKFDKPLVTRVLIMSQFQPSQDRFQNYYKAGPDRPFCTAYIDPKLALLRREFSAHL